MVCVEELCHAAHGTQLQGHQIQFPSEGKSIHFAEGDHVVSLCDDVQDVVWTPRGAMGKHERLWRT